jgi:hypothetical protein
MARGDRRASGDVLIGADGVARYPEDASRSQRSAHPSAYLAVRGVARDATHHPGSLDGIYLLGTGVEAE